MREEDTRQLILFGAGGAGIRTLHQIGKDRVYAFCDNHKAGQTVEGKVVIGIDTLNRINENGQYRVMICVVSSYAACEIAQQLQEKVSCKYELCEECKNNCEWNLAHIVGERIEYCSNTQCSQARLSQWYLLYMQMMDKYRKEFVGRKIDFWIYLSDKAEVAYWAVKLGVVDNKRIFAFNTIDEMDDIVIPVPDYIYHSFLGGEKGEAVRYEECIDEFRKCQELPWEYDKAFWIGNLSNHSSRKKLYCLGKEHSDDLEIDPIDWNDKSNFIPMIEWRKYKYLIDARGYGWTDRLKILFMIGRPIFVNERPYIEFWMRYGLKEGKHYISVKEDFSDLLEKKKKLDLSPQKYKKITEEMRTYNEKYLSKDFALEYLKNVLLEYGSQNKY